MTAKAVIASIEAHIANGSRYSVVEHSGDGRIPPKVRKDLKPADVPAEARKMGLKREDALKAPTGRANELGWPVLSYCSEYDPDLGFRYLTIYAY